MTSWIALNANNSRNNNDIDAQVVAGSTESNSTHFQWHNIPKVLPVCAKDVIKILKLIFFSPRHLFKPVWRVKYKRPDALSLWHQQCKPEERPGAWLAAPAISTRGTTKLHTWRMILDVDQHYIGSVMATTHQEKGIITLESNPSRGTVLPAPHGKGNKCDRNVKYKRTDALSLWHQQ